ncbi:iron-sulfur cluster assembly scaffold protein [Candidatus Fermentibacteria bacterium]|nr:iron-sulfur cluster assembly scaffold protein [Candidatus Fermentibacteria bacterium]
MDDPAGSVEPRHSDVYEAQGMADSPTCGDVVRVALTIDGSIIVGTGYRVYGCGSAMARTAEALSAVKGRTVEVARELIEAAMEREAGPGNGNGGCAAAEMAVLAALDEFTLHRADVSGS